MSFTFLFRTKRCQRHDIHSVHNVQLPDLLVLYKSKKSNVNTNKQYNIVEKIQINASPRQKKLNKFITFIFRIAFSFTSA